MRSLFITCSTILLFWPLSVHAQIVISEVMWSGTDLSSADEWLEIGTIGSDSVDISGWTLTSLKSSGEEGVIARFGTGTILESGSFLIVSHFAASDSRLLEQPVLVSSSVSLPNTKLLLKLLDTSGSIRDTVDDGAGAPFAGSNPSGGLGRASMERIDLDLPGTVKENWRTAAVSKGFDTGSSVFGSPGFGPEPDTEEPPKCQNSSIGIAVQEGSLVGVGKTTVNFQAVALSGSMVGITCVWNFSDGFRSSSCNPPAHLFDNVGTTIVALEAVNQCGNTLKQEQRVEVLPLPGSAPDPVTKTYDGSRLFLFSALPNPEGSDTGKEWIEIKNLEDKSVSLDGYKIRVGETSLRSYPLKGTIGPRERLKIFNGEVSFTLPNAKSKLELLSPAGTSLSTIAWEEGEEGRIFFTEDIRKMDLRVSLVSVIDSESILVNPGEAVLDLFSPNPLVVRLLGVTSSGSQTVKGIELGKVLTKEEFIRALIEDQILELDFDTELWDSSGRLLAYITVPSIGSVQERLFGSGGWNADRALKYKQKERFISLEQVKSPVGPLIELASAKEDSVHTKAISGSLSFSSTLRISEVYSSPFPGAGSGELALTGEEWLEIENFGEGNVNLDGWSMRVNGKKKVLREGLNLNPYSLIIIKTSEMKLALKNDGTTIELFSPDGTVVSALAYPKLKHGFAYAQNPEGSYCITITPTPGESNICTEQVKKVRKVAAPKQAAKTKVKKASPAVRKYATDYKAQVQDEILEFGDEPSEGSSGVPAMIFAFFLGVLGTSVPLVFFIKKLKVPISPPNP